MRDYLCCVTTVLSRFNYIDLHGNATDLYTIVEINVLLSLKSTNPDFSSILCHLAFQAASKRFRRVCVVRVSSARQSSPFRDTRSAKRKKSVDIIPSVLIPP